jgi:hypothetical protein
VRSVVLEWLYFQVIENRLCGRFVVSWFLLIAVETDRTVGLFVLFFEAI